MLLPFLSALWGISITPPGPKAGRPGLITRSIKEIAWPRFEGPARRAPPVEPRVITYKNRNGVGTPVRALVILGRKTVWVGLRGVTAAAGRSGRDSWPSASVWDRGRYRYSCHPERREGSQPATMMRFFAGPRMTVRRTFFSTASWPGRNVRFRGPWRGRGRLAPQAPGPHLAAAGAADRADCSRVLRRSRAYRTWTSYSGEEYWIKLR